MAPLLDWITERITPDTVATIANRLGESDAAVARGLPTAVTSVLASLVTNTNDAGTMRQVFDLVTSRDNNAGASKGVDVGAIVDGALNPGSATSSLGATLVSTLLGTRTNDVGGAISRAAGFNKMSSGSSLLSLAAPVVLGFLGRRVRERGLSLSSFTSMLAGERDSVLSAVPSTLRGLVDVGAAPVGAGRPAAQAPAIAVPERRGNRWLWPAVAAAAALALLWAMLGRRTVPDAVTAATDSVLTMTRVTVDSSLAVGRRTFDTAAGALANTARDLGGMVRRALPSGVSLNVPERGIESKLVAFIEDNSRAVNDTTWFDFDRLNFATGSTNILPESQEQIDNIAAVLRAYPNVKVKVGGYTDNTGDSATNLRLSQARADAVRQALITKGIAGSRMTAEGYGDKHPVADNTTLEGRAKNRRIALRVTAK